MSVSPSASSSSKPRCGARLAAARAVGAATPTGTPCQDHYLRNGRDEISERIKDAAPRAAAVLEGIHEHAANAAVYVVNYLPILPDKQPPGGKGCWPTVPVTDSDARYLRDKEVELNKMLADAVAADPATTNKAKLVDVYIAGIGLDACEKPGTRWVEPQVAPVGAAPLHPNLDGMKGTAKAVEDAVKSSAAQ
jgi:hypothetical protein